VHNPRHFVPEKLATVQECREDYRCGGWKKRSVWWRAREIRSVPRHAEFLRWREWFHAADPIKRGNRRTARPEVELRMESFEIIAAGDPCSVFDRWVDTLKRAGIEATQIGIAEYDRERGYNPITHPRGREVYVLVPVERLEEALRILKASEQSNPG